MNKKVSYPRPREDALFVEEHNGINLHAEQGLHAGIKRLLFKSGDRAEAAICGKIIDLVRANGELVEIQTSGFGKLWPKVHTLQNEGHRIRVVVPLAETTHIHRLDPASGELVSIRKSPKRCNLYSVFDYLINAPLLISAKRVKIEVLLVTLVEFRSRNGKGSWRRRGDSTVEKVLGEVRSRKVFSRAADWLRVITDACPPPWNSVALAKALCVNPDVARKILYCYAKAGLIVHSHNQDRSKQYCLPK